MWAGLGAGRLHSGEGCGGTWVLGLEEPENPSRLSLLHLPSHQVSCSDMSYRFQLRDGPRAEDAIDGLCQVVGVKKNIF